MVNAVTTNVTEFFRNPKQFDIFSRHRASSPIDINKVKKTFRILSAGCSSGEEPYTIAVCF